MPDLPLDVTVTVIVPVRFATTEYALTAPAVPMLLLSEAPPLEFKVTGLAPLNEAGECRGAVCVPLALPTGLNAAAGAGGPINTALLERTQPCGACVIKGLALKRVRVSNGSNESFRVFATRFLENVRSDSIKTTHWGW
jgi:hypothetical protein